MASIVFCEDQAVIQKLIRIALRATSHHITIAVDGAAGLEQIEAQRPDIIFTDISMPELDGLQLIDAVRSRPHLSHIPIVVMTASVQQAQLDECYRHGATGHLAKPFSIEDLRAKVEEHSRRSGGPDPL